MESQGFLIEAVIYIYAHASSIQLLDNTFSHCGGAKGPVIIELAQTTPSTQPHPRTFILHNTFEYNTGIFSASALALFSSVGTTTLSSDSSFCGGFHVEANNFIRNSIIYEGGIVKHQCFSSLSQASIANFQIIHEYTYEDTS